jgi:hypothetical protein
MVFFNMARSPEEFTVVPIVIALAYRPGAEPKLRPAFSCVQLAEPRLRAPFIARSSSRRKAAAVAAAWRRGGRCPL